MKRFVFGLLAVCGALLLAGPARAQDPPISSGIFTLNPDGSIGTGMFDVTVQQSYDSGSGLFTDTVTVKDDPSHMPGDSASTNPDANQIEVELYTGYNETGSLDTTVDNTPTNSEGGSGGEHYGGATYFFPSTQIPLDSLNDSFSIQTNEQIDSAAMQIYDGSGSTPTGNEWSGQGNLTPEPAALALALPGLLPLWLGLKRRRRGSGAPAVS